MVGVAARPDFFPATLDDIGVLQEEAGKQLGWLDFVAGFEGSVEKSSLEKAQMINTRGFYLIQCEEGAIPSVKNSIKLILVEENKSKTKYGDSTRGESRKTSFLCQECL